MTATIHDINAVRIQRALGQQVSIPTRTEIQKHVCPRCEGFGLLRVCKGLVVPIAMEDALRGQIPCYICAACAGVGAVYCEVVLEGEAV